MRKKAHEHICNGASKQNMMELANFPCLVLLCFVALVLRVQTTPIASTNWKIQYSLDGIKFTGRNGLIWVTGGRVESYILYNLLDSYKMADVWYSSDGATWKSVENMQGDFFAQNFDVVQPGSIAPWFQRYGHSLNAIDINGDGIDDVMVLAGGFASSPVNDVWFTYDGIEWVYAGFAPWSERAWHATTVFDGKLWLMGGTPLNNEVWCLESVTKVSRTVEPLTRAMFSNFTFVMDWQLKTTAPWSPRVGMGLISHYFFNSSAGEGYSQSRERMLLIGGYGGWPQDGAFGKKDLFDGFYSRSDTWESYDGFNWTQLTANNVFGGRAWMALALQRGKDKKVDPRQFGNETLSPKIYLFGGGYIGFNIANKKRVTSMVGRSDAYWTRDGLKWTKINYEEGGGSTGFVYFSSQEWARTVVDTQTKYLGMWGHTVHSFNISSKEEYPGELFFIAGDYDGGGKMSNIVYKNAPGLHCDVNGVACNGRGSCNATGCFCTPEWEGLYCETQVGQITAGALLTKSTNVLMVGLLVSAMALFNSLP